MRKNWRWWWVVSGLILVASGCQCDGGSGEPDDSSTSPPGTEGPCPPSCAPPPPEPLRRQSEPNPIPAENQKPGEPGWRSGRHATSGEVEVYASSDSVAVGDTLRVKVSTRTPVQVTAEVFRLGYYGGAGARRVWSGGPFSARKQPDCPRDPATARVECSWADTFQFTVEAGWVSGVYLVKVMHPNGFLRFAPFVVHDTRAAEVFFGVAFNRHQAYNVWGGESLYVDASGTMPNGRAHQVSYDRPYLEGEGAGHLLHWEYWLVRFLEERGYDVTYGTNLDFIRYTGVLQGISAYVHGGHDEYWPTEQRQQVDAALASGEMSLAYFGANGAYWRTRSLSNSAGEPLRTLVCYKNESEKDPRPGSTVRFRDPPNAQPENALFGTMYDGWELIPFPLTVKDANHWLFAGTGLTTGTQLPGLLGYEFDRIWDNGLTPEGLLVSMESPLVTAEGVPNRSHVVDRTLPSGRLVFSVGSIYWPLALSDDPESHDARVVRMTENVLEWALSHRRSPRTLPAITGPIPTQPAPQGEWATSVESFAGQAGRAGWVDGPAEQALFNGPTGLAADSQGRVVVADTNNQRIRLIENDPARTVTTISGNGLPGLRNGPGAQAMFRAPTGVAIARDGSIYVADSDNHVIRRIANDPPAYTVTTYAGTDRKQGWVDGPAEQARFRRPTALAVDAADNLYVADQAGNRIRMIVAGTHQVVTLAGSGKTGFADAAVGTQAVFNNPSAIAVTPLGTVYVFDAGNQRLRRIDASEPHAVTSLAGRPEGALGFADGNGLSARFRAQMGLARSPEGEALILADTANYRLRGIVPGADAASTRVFTLAGSGRLGSALGPGQTADIVAPTGVAFLLDGRLLVSDSFNNVVRLIRR